MGLSCPDFDVAWRRISRSHSEHEIQDLKRLAHIEANKDNNAPVRLPAVDQERCMKRHNSLREHSMDKIKYCPKLADLVKSMSSMESALNRIVHLVVLHDSLETHDESAVQPRLRHVDSMDLIPQFLNQISADFADDTSSTACSFPSPPPAPTRKVMDMDAFQKPQSFGVYACSLPHVDSVELIGKQLEDSGYFLDSNGDVFPILSTAAVDNTEAQEVAAEDLEMHEEAQVHNDVKIHKNAPFVMGSSFLKECACA